MIALIRAVRFAINPQGAQTSTGPDPNGYAGVPSIRGLGRHYEIRVRCVGDNDPTTGYLLDIKDVDRAVRSAVVPLIQAAADSAPQTDPAQLLPRLSAALFKALPAAAGLRWCLS